MKKTIPVFMTLMLLTFSAAFAFAGTITESNKAQFQFTTFGMTNNSWDYALIHYSVSDVANGTTIDIPSFLIKYEVRDRQGKTVSSGSGLYVNLMDYKLGSEEDYTVIASTMINGQKVSQAICGKASPKKLAASINVTGNDLSPESLAEGINYTFTRPKFSNRNENEKIKVDPTDISVAIALDNCINCATHKLDVSANHAPIAEQAAYKSLEKDIKKLTKDGRQIQMTAEPVLTFKGEVYTDNQVRYELTANGMSQISSDEAVASK